MKYLILLVILFLLLGSCKKDDNLEKINSDILVSAENIENRVAIFAETEKMHSCLGHEIIYFKKIENNEIYIDFKKIKAPEVCLMALGPATCKIELESLSTGEYNVFFKLNNQITEGKLMVDSNSEIILSSGGNVKPN